MDLFTWLLWAMSVVSLGEGLNCYFPYHDGEYENSGTICQWEHDDFYYDEKEGKWILLPEDSDDNIVEAKVRERYWKKRGGE